MLSAPIHILGEASELPIFFLSAVLHIFSESGTQRGQFSSYQPTSESQLSLPEL